jgi:hypothetical protein
MRRTLATVASELPGEGLIAEHDEVVFCNDRDQRGFDLGQNGLRPAELREEVDEALAPRGHVRVVLDVFRSQVVRGEVDVSRLGDGSNPHSQPTTNADHADGASRRALRTLSGRCEGPRGENLSGFRGGA